MPSVSSVDATGRATVEFRLPSEAGVEQAWLAGEFNDWSTDGMPLRRLDDGSLTVTMQLEPGTYRFRYFLGDGAWENDWAADAYADNEHGGQDSVIVVPPAAAAPPPVMGDEPAAAAKKSAGKKSAAKKAAAKKAPAKKAAAKKAAAKKTAGAKKAATKKAATKKKAPPG